MLKAIARAKINLTLEVTGKRPDGYHELATVLQTIDLADTLCFQRDNGLHLDCDDPSLESPDNLVLRAAGALQEGTAGSGGAAICLAKRIPSACGLGGGSADAAATLLALDRLWGLGLKRAELLRVASRLGSDVPFFLHGGTALGQGRGEQVSPLPPLPETWLILLVPPIAPTPQKTGRLYASLRPEHFTAGEFTRKLLAHLEQGRGLHASVLYNVFEAVAFDFFPGLDLHRQRLLAVGVERVHLAGSGPCLFALVGGRERGGQVLRALDAQGESAYLLRTVPVAVDITCGCGGGG